MDPLRRSVLEGLRHGRPSEAALTALGDPEPGRTARALETAAADPDLADSVAEWVPTLLLTARPGFAAQCLEELARRYRQATGRPLDLRSTPTLPSVLGSSDFLARLLLRHPDWSDELRGSPPPAPAADPVEADWTAIRIAKYRGLLRIAARDLAERDFEQSLRELSDLADQCLIAALNAAAHACAAPPPALIALGKLGGRELNFSSDVDVMFVYDARSDEDDAARNDAACRVVRTLKTHLEARSEDGFGYRVDLDLRPEGRTGTLANSTEGILTYYETFGVDWERQMLIRARYVAGPREVAEIFDRDVTPFVYRRLIDPSAIRAVREMKSRIESERRREGRDLEMNLKEGPGGIRDVEFLVQSLQLFHGGTLPSIRLGNVPEGLRALGRTGILPEEAAAGLVDDYLWLRRAEHAVQLVEERQTHAVPRDRQAQTALARRMGYRLEEASRARDRMLEDWTATRTRVREQFEALVLHEDRSAGAGS